MYVPVLLVVSLGVMAVGVLLIQINDDRFHGLVWILWGLDAVLTVALMLLFKKKTATLTMITLVLSMIVSATLWGAIRGSLASSVNAVVVLGVLVLTIMLTVVRAEAGDKGVKKPLMR